jgi:ATP-dependent Clp protease ATP-binding subunit ClpX
MAKAGPIVCSFCGRDKKEVKVLIAGVTGHICDVCISQALKNIWTSILLDKTRLKKY